MSGRWARRRAKGESGALVFEICLSRMMLVTVRASVSGEDHEWMIGGEVVSEW